MSSAAATVDKLEQQRGVQLQPLTQREIEQISRFLSDPSVFPREFKRWVTDHSSDTVDIAKSQVHGLVSSSGQVISGPAELHYAPFATYMSFASGSEQEVKKVDNVECNGGPVDVTIFIPYAQFFDMLFFLYLDGMLQGAMGRMTAISSGGAMAQMPVNLTQRLKPAAGPRDFRITVRSVGAGTTVLAGSYTVANEVYGPGYFRISKA